MEMGKELIEDELNSHWSRKREGSRQGFIYLDELTQGIFPLQNQSSGLAFSPQITPGVLVPPYRCSTNIRG
jgi:hypothetical protein